MSDKDKDQDYSFGGIHKVELSVDDEFLTSAVQEAQQLEAMK